MKIAKSENYRTITMPIGGIVAWMKGMTGVPSLPAEFVECNGGTISDADSPLNGQSIPDLSTTNRFLRGNTTSGTCGGSDTHTHTFATTCVRYGSAGGGDSGYAAACCETGQTSSSTATSPQHMETVFIMRIK